MSSGTDMLYVCAAWCYLLIAFTALILHMHVITQVTQRFYQRRTQREQSDYGDIRTHTRTLTVCMFGALLLLTRDQLWLAVMLPEKMMRTDSML